MGYVPIQPGPWASRTVVHLRTSGNAGALAHAVQREIHDLDKTAAVFKVTTVQAEVDQSLVRERLLSTVTTLFGCVPLALSALGLDRLVSYGVARRTREFGIRIAMGAEAGGIARMVIREALWLLLAGAAIGLGAAWALGRLVRALLFGIEPADPMSGAAAILALATAAMIAAWVPTRRAARVDPMRALRWD